VINCDVCKSHPYACARHPRLEPAVRHRLLARVRREEAASLRASYRLNGYGAECDAASRAERLRLAATGRHCFDCGAPFPKWEPDTGSTGYAILRQPEGARVCYPCVKARERADFAKADSFFGYLTRDADGRPLFSSWTGGALARVTWIAARRVGFANYLGRAQERYYFKAVAPDGSRWHGCGPGFGMYARVRRAKGTK